MTIFDKLKLYVQVGLSAIKEGISKSPAGRATDKIKDGAEPLKAFMESIVDGWDLASDLLSSFLDEMSLEYIYLMFDNLPENALGLTDSLKSGLDEYRTNKVNRTDILNKDLKNAGYGNIADLLRISADIPFETVTDTEVIVTKPTKPAPGEPILEADPLTLTQPTSEPEIAESDLFITSTEPIKTGEIEPSIDDTMSEGNMLFKSPPIINKDVLVKKNIVYNTVHIALSTTISIVQIVTEIYTIGQVDKVLECLLVLYNMSPFPRIYDRTMDARLEASFIRPYRYMIEAEHKSVIPNPADLIRFLTREQFSQNPVEGLTLFKRFMSYQGFHEYWSEAYWGAHWELPNTSELFEMYGRGIINLEQLKAQVIINDIHPDWIDNIVALAEKIPSRTEARLMGRGRKLTDKQMDIILDAERIRDDFKDDYKFFLQNQEIDNIRIQLAREYLEQMEKGYITEQEYTFKLQNLPFEKEEISDNQINIIKSNITDSLYSPLEILANTKLANEKINTRIKDLDIGSIKNRAKRDFKEGRLTDEEIRTQIATVIKHEGLADAIGDNLLSQLGADFSIDLIELLFVSEEKPEEPEEKPE